MFSSAATRSSSSQSGEKSLRNTIAPSSSNRWISSSGMLCPMPSTYQGQCADKTWKRRSHKNLTFITLLIQYHYRTYLIKESFYYVNWYNTLVLKLCYLWTLHRKEWQLHSIVATWLTHIKTILLLLQLRNLLPDDFHMGLAAYCDSLAFLLHSLQNAIVRIWLEQLNKRMRSFSFHFSHHVVIRILKILSILKFKKKKSRDRVQRMSSKGKRILRGSAGPLARTPSPDSKKLPK